jgi:hypothetical protein
MRELTGVPWLFIVAMALTPIVVCAFLGAIAFRRMTPLVFSCRRCNREFYRKAHHGFPTVCPLCKARDWNA